MADARTRTLRDAVMRHCGGFPIGDHEAEAILAAVDASTARPLPHAQTIELCRRKDDEHLHVHDIAHALVIRSATDDGEAAR